jgi:hypothetical protein
MQWLALQPLLSNPMPCALNQQYFHFNNLLLQKLRYLQQQQQQQQQHQQLRPPQFYTMCLPTNEVIF